MRSRIYRITRAVLGNITLHYVEAGPKTDETAVLLHGWPQSSFAWRHVQPELANRFGAATAYAIAAEWRGRVATLAILDMLIPGFGLEDAVRFSASVVADQLVSTSVADLCRAQGVRVIEARPAALETV